MATPLLSWNLRERSTLLYRLLHLVDCGVACGKEIKQRLCTEVGSYMRCNIGIGTNCFWAKMAASLHKPDGLDVVTAQNILTVLASLTLRDLTGIARHNEQRLNAVGIFTPLQMYESSPEAAFIIL